MIIKHTESISFETKTEWRQAVDFGIEHRDWVKTDGTDTVTYTKENVWIYDLDEERKDNE